MADVPLIVISEFAQAERRITPSWSISQLKSKLETVTGIPPSCQTLSLKTPGAEAISLEAANEDGTHLSNYPLVPYAELHVSPTEFSFVLPLSDACTTEPRKFLARRPRRTLKLTSTPPLTSASSPEGWVEAAPAHGACLERSPAIPGLVIKTTGYQYALFFPLLPRVVQDRADRDLPGR